ncbi:nucleoside-diphosphate-sugar epimerase [Cohnella sp. SGD-V74]|uniref:NAD-dependent epimerase/dehydratase family protein n=1 Tax=unclassified Cohnella TaxID=2636738 RepID=UPI000D46D47E|nr:MULTISPECIES: NAD-dependent epimerase/dehydratase family protein [unclassified Cohnella]PRX59174.1 nucleoside-diphosphate-sugar epimerase [Cohnella sp. SGD-V74]
MKVLITGGYGFIGSHVADRFFKEGYEVFIIDNLSTGNKANVQIKHRGYTLDVTDPKCEEIFRAYRFDTVVHLAAQISVGKSLANPQLDTDSNVLGTVNMLDLSVKYGVKRFIYASSAAVYGLDETLPHLETKSVEPISPYGISKYVNELYADKWHALHGLSTIGFRFSNVYGPRQSAEGEGGVISIFMNNMLQDKPLKVFGDGEQTRDFIYVEDVADAVYRSANSSHTGIYNLSVNRQDSVNEIIRSLSEIRPDLQVQHEPPRPQDILHSRLDNSAVMRDLDWSPLYGLKEGLERTYAYFASQAGEKEAAATAAADPAPARARPKLPKWLMPTFENLLAFALTAWLSLSIVSNMYGVIDVKLFYITIVGILYGNRQALLAVALSIGLLTYQELQAGRDLVSLTYDTDFFFSIAIYLFIGLVVGYAIQRKNVRISQQERKAAEASERYEFLEDIYKEVREVKDELQLRIMNAGDSYGKIYYATKELESLEPEAVFNSAVNVVKSIMRVEKVAIYRINKYQNFLRLLASSGYDAKSLDKSLRVSDFGHLQHMLQNGQMYTNKQLEPGLPLMAVPLYHHDQVAAVIAIDGMKFESFSLYQQNLFQITADLIASSLSKAFTFIEATENHRYVEGTRIMQPAVFKEIVQTKHEAKLQHHIPYLLLQCSLNQFSPQEAAQFIEPLLRETDYVGLAEEGRFQLLLSNTSKQDLNTIMPRLSHPQISFTVVNEE